MNPDLHDQFQHPHRDDGADSPPAPTTEYPSETPHRRHRRYTRSDARAKAKRVQKRRARKGYR